MSSALAAPGASSNVSDLVRTPAATVGGVERGPFFLKLPPSPQQLSNLTAIEAPNRMFLSPSVLGGWSHRPRADVMNGRTELWHTRLGVRRTDGTVDEADEFNRAMHVIWSPDYRSLVGRAVNGNSNRHKFLNYLTLTAHPHGCL